MDPRVKPEVDEGGVDSPQPSRHAIVILGLDPSHDGNIVLEDSSLGRQAVATTPA